MIADQRREARELAAQSLAPPADSVAKNLKSDHLRLVLDSAIDDFTEAGRTAVVVRFIEQHPFADVGAALRVSEDAARVRTTAIWRGFAARARCLANWLHRSSHWISATNSPAAG